MAAAVHRLQKWVRGPVIGRGATATVSLATCPVTGSQFAVKSVDLRQSASLQREQRFLASIPPSPYVVPYLGFDVTTGGQGGAAVCNLFLELAPGGSVADEIARFGRLEQRKVRGFARDIVQGLAHLHSNGIAHCDVKPGNVLLDGTGCKLADLGCAKWLDGDAAAAAVVGGSPMYMAPEVARGEAQGTAADVWALGCTVLEMATGRPPWPDAKDPVAAMHTIGFSGDVPELPKGLEDDARDFLRKCFARDPAERWSTEELLAHPFTSTSCNTGKREGEDRVFSFSLGDDGCNWQWRQSPKCVLDGDDLWDCRSSASTSASSSMGDFEAEEDQQHDQDAPSTIASSPHDRIGQLAGPNSCGTWAAVMMSCSSWAWDWNKIVEDNNGDGPRGWITIRGSSSHSGGRTGGPFSSSDCDSESKMSLTALPGLPATNGIAAVTASSSLRPGSVAAVSLVTVISKNHRVKFRNKQQYN